MPPTIVLVHGAFAESASWDHVIDQSVSDLVRTIEGPIVLVAHSYGARAQRTVVVEGASHAIAVSQPGAVAELIVEAARLPAAA